MSLDTQAVPEPPLDEPAGFDDSKLAPDWAERIITVVATVLGVTVVAAIAVLTGLR